MSQPAWRPRIGAIIWTIFTVIFVFAAVGRLLSGGGNPLLPILVLLAALMGAVGIWRVLSRDTGPDPADSPRQEERGAAGGGTPGGAEPSSPAVTDKGARAPEE